MTEDAALQGKRILVIEDDYYLATDEATSLQAAGATVVGCTADSQEARDFIAREAIDFALVDINLGYGPSFESARSLRESQIPFVFTTGYDANAIPDEFSDVPRLEKPFEQRKLLELIERLL